MDCTHIRIDHFDSHIYRDLSFSGITITLYGMGESWNLYFGYHFIPIKCSGSFEIRKEGHFYLAFILFYLVCHFVLEAFLNKHALEHC